MYVLKMPCLKPYVSCVVADYKNIWFVEKVEEVQQNIHKMVSSWNYGASELTVFNIQPHCRGIQSDQIGNLSNKEDFIKSVNNSEIPKDAHPIVHDLKINNEMKTSKNTSETFDSNNSRNLSHLHEQCFVAADTNSESICVSEYNVECIKIEEDPLQIDNYNINSDVDTVHAFSYSINCESLPSELVSIQLPNDTECDISADTSSTVSASDTPSQSTEYGKNKKPATKSLEPINSLRKKCNEKCMLDEMEGDTEDVQGIASRKFQNGRRNALNNEPESHGEESQSESGCSVPSEENDGWEESENKVHTLSNELPLNIQLAKFYKYNCKMCEPDTVTYSSFFLLRKHYRLEHNTKGYVICCERKLMSRPVLVSHMLNHLQPGLFKCHECGKELANVVTYEKHLIHHLPDQKRPFKCEHCLRGFACKADLQSHLRIHLPDNERSAPVCNICGKKFSTQGSVASHQRHVHEKVREVMCHICAKIFPSQSALREHLYTHVAKSEQRQCHECGKWLKNDSTLRSHMKGHSTQLFTCPQCNKVYNFPQSLRAHIQSHTSTHLYKCPVCEKTFKLKKGLKAHAVQHTGERPYQCPHCPRIFASNSNCHSHKKRMHAREEQGSGLV